MSAIRNILVLVACLEAGSVFSAVRVTPMNSAEAVFAPFWDSNLEELRKWQVKSGEIRSSWCNADFFWKRQAVKEGQAAFSMVLSEHVDCNGYDRLLVSARVPVSTEVVLSAVTETGEIASRTLATSTFRAEYALDLKGAATVSQVQFQVFDTGKSTSCSGSLFWMGLQNQKELAHLLQQQDQVAQQPLDVFLNPAPGELSFTGRMNLLARPEDLRKLQEAYLELPPEQAAKLSVDPKKSGMEQKLEAFRGDTLPFANETLFGRVRDDGRSLPSIRTLIQMALITKNKAALELAARTAIRMALTPNWDSTFLSDFMDSGWDQRPFSHASVTEAAALALDYCDELLSRAGRNLLGKRMSLDGIGQVNYCTWRYSYIFDCNQLAVFARGRMASYLALEKLNGWNGKRVMPYTELGFQEVCDSAEKIIYPDGSFLEGVGYMSYTISCLQPIFEMYAIARNRPLPEVVPKCMNHLGAFGDVFVSTDRRGGMIPNSSGQGNARHMPLHIYQFLSMLAPESQWTNLYNEGMRSRGNDWVPELSFLVKRQEISRAFVVPKPLAQLPIMGVVASTREKDGLWSKILLIGSKKHANCHRHNDRGSFVLEYGGDTFAADPGGQNYSDADGELVKRSDYHSMLVAAEMPDNEELFLAQENVYPVANGDKISFHAEMEAAPANYNYFKSWKRTLDSPAPDAVDILDTFEMTEKHKAARFIWITELPWKLVEPGLFRLDGKSTYALVRFPKEYDLVAQTLTIRQKEKFTRLSFVIPGQKSSCSVQVRFYAK